MLVAIPMDWEEKIQFSTILTEVQLRQVVEQGLIAAAPLEALVLEVHFHKAVMAAEEVRAVVVEAVRRRAGQMVVLVLQEQVEQGFHLRFLATMEEMPKSMVRVETADQTESLVSSLE
jgi:hypothetical protein